MGSTWLMVSRSMLLAVTTLPVLTTNAHNLVVDQIAPGYRYGNGLLRPAQVVVGKLSRPEYRTNSFGWG